MAQDMLGGHDATSMSSLGLIDIVADMPPLRLSDIMSPEAEVEITDIGTPVDSGHEISPQSTQEIADLEVNPIASDSSAPAREVSETARRLQQDVLRLNEENRLLRQKLYRLQTNSNLKQVALIGTVISWFGDKGLLGDDMDAVYELTSMMMSARATEEQAIPAFADQRNAAPDELSDEFSGVLTEAVNVRNIGIDDTSNWPSPSFKLEGSFNPPFSSSKKAMRNHVPLKSGNEGSKFKNPESMARRLENEDTYEWPSQSDGSFNPPFSSSKKAHPVPLQRDATLLAEGPRELRLRDDQSAPSTPVVLNLPRDKVNTDSFDNRIQQMEKTVKVFSGRHADMRSRMTTTRQNSAKQFRIWKAIAASRKLADVNSLQDEDEAGDDDLATMMRAQSLTPTPMTQHPCHSAKEASTMRAVDVYKNKTILGEIAFQTERRILAFVFQRRDILYGDSLGNLEIMIRTHPDQGSRSALLRRYELLMDVLRGYGWLRGRHSQFVADMIARHGIFQNVESAQAEAINRGWSNPSELKRGVLCLCPVVEVLDLLVILDCLLHMARNDGMPVFLF